MQSVSEHSVTLLAVQGGDRFLIRRWLGEPHVATWWGERSTAEAKVAVAQSSDGALSRMIEIDGRPVGYAHALDVAHSWGVLPPDIPAGAYEVDLFIGERAAIGAGVGRIAIDRLVREVFATTLTPACAAVVPIRNERAVRGYEQAGFRWVSVWHPTGRDACWIMVRNR